MGWRDTWYPNAVAALNTLRGEGAPGTDGVPMPLLKAYETISVLGQLSPTVVSAIKRFQLHETDRDDLISSAHVDGDGALAIGGSIGAAGLSPESYGATFVSVEDYLAGKGSAAAAYKRHALGVSAIKSGSQTIVIGPLTYEPWTEGGSIAEGGLLSVIRSLVASWDRAVVTSANAILGAGANAGAEIKPADAAPFWSAIRSLCADLDVLSENPPASTRDRITGALDAAMDRTSTWAGESAAAVADRVGETAGQAMQGFFDKAGFMSILVAGVALFLFIK